MTASALPPSGRLDQTSFVGRRIGAWVIDLLVYLILGVLVTFAFGGIEARTWDGFEGTATMTAVEEAEAFCETGSDRTGRVREDVADARYCFVSGEEETTSVLTIDGSFAGAWFWGVHLLAYGVLSGLLGGSIGKLAVGLRVVTEDGTRAGVGRNVLRTGAWIADAVTCGIPIVGGVLLVSTRGHRRLGDMMAGTYVVPKSAVGQPVVLPSPHGAPVPYDPHTAHQRAADGAWIPAPGPGMPPAPPAGPPPGTPGVSSTPSAEEPSWDAERGAYIQYDRELEDWMQWDDAVKRWRPITR